MDSYKEKIANWVESTALSILTTPYSCYGIVGDRQDFVTK
jgi:hypothetical protein